MAAARPRRSGFYFTAGFLSDRRLRRILSLAGFDLRLGRPRQGDDVLVWGRSRYARRGEAVARATAASLIRVEDAFLRSLHPGRTGDPPLGLVIDRQGIYFDATAPSDLETLLATHPLDAPTLLDRAGAAIRRLREEHLSKYSATDPALAPPAPGYVLVVDQTRGDASIRHGMAGEDSFAAMLAAARAEHPDAPIVIKTHPETRAGHRAGHFDAATLPDRVTLEDRPISPTRLLEGAGAVYCVTSQLGFEACLAGHRPVCFGVPFYAGWGLTEDRVNVPARRGRPLSVAQLAAAALILYPTWYDPYRDQLCELETVLDTLEAQSRAWREDRAGYVAIGMRSWKKPHLRAGFGSQGARLSFAETLAQADTDTRPVMVWAGRETPDLAADCAAQGRSLFRIEDGMIRSRGLGAELVPPLSLVRDPLGIYYDPTRESLLERHIADAATRPAERLQRARSLVVTLTRAGVTKYNLDGASDLPAAAPGQEVILLPGQVEDDASIRLGAGEVRRNADLLRTARRLYPDAFLIYKPHPDVVAGLRAGALTDPGLADHITTTANAAALLAQVDRVVTITSTLGFEALLRGVAVTTLGAPFYAGWGLTEDLGPVPKRRVARPSLDALAHAVLITYPRYFDPVTGTACPPEVALDRLISGEGLKPKPSLRALAKLQGWFAGHVWLWRGR